MADCFIEGMIELPKGCWLDIPKVSSSAKDCLKRNNICLNGLNTSFDWPLTVYIHYSHSNLGLFWIDHILGYYWLNLVKLSNTGYLKAYWHRYIIFVQCIGDQLQIKKWQGYKKWDPLLWVWWEAKSLHRAQEALKGLSGRDLEAGEVPHNSVWPTKPRARWNAPDLCHAPRCIRSIAEVLNLS